MTDNADNERDERWRRERAHFDAQAARSSTNVYRFDDATVDAYRNPRARMSKEFRFGIMGDLHGKRVLDVGCNDGENSVLLARLGAEVVGVDISEGSIALADQRAEVNGVADTTRFIAAPIETVDLDEQSFDIVWCHGFLHHVLNELPLVLDKLTSWAKPDGMLVIYEPVSNRLMRRMRRLIPVPEDYGTPDERPLHDHEVDLIASNLRDPQRRYFRGVGRLYAMLRLPGLHRLHDTQAAKLYYHALAYADQALLSLPMTHGLGSMIALWGPPRR